MGLWLRDITPCAPSDDVADRGLVQPVAASDGPLRVACSGSHSDNVHVCGRQLRHGFDVSSFLHHVGSIVSGRAEEQVIDAAACWYVAPVANKQAFADRAELGLPDDSGDVLIASVRKADHSVALGAFGSSPQCASIRVRRRKILCNPVNNGHMLRASGHTVILPSEARVGP